MRCRIDGTITDKEEARAYAELSRFHSEHWDAMVNLQRGIVAGSVLSTVLLERSADGYELRAEFELRVGATRRRFVRTRRAGVVANSPTVP